MHFAVPRFWLLALATPIVGVTGTDLDPRVLSSDTAVAVAWTSPALPGGLGTCSPLVGGGYALSSPDLASNYLAVPVEAARLIKLSAEICVMAPVQVPYRGTSPGLRLRFGSEELVVAFSPDGQRIQHTGALGSYYGGPRFQPGAWYRVEVGWQEDGLTLQYFDASGTALNQPTLLPFKDEAQAQRWRGAGELRLGAFNHLGDDSAVPQTVQVRNLDFSRVPMAPEADTAARGLAEAQPALVGLAGLIHEFADFGKSSRLSYDAKQAVIGLENPGYGTNYLEIPVDGARLKTFQTEFRLSCPVATSSRTKAPGLMVRFGSRYVWVRFTADAQRIQWGGTEGSNYGGARFTPGEWYRLHLTFFGNRAEIRVQDEQGRDLATPAIMPFRVGPGVEDWRGAGVVQVGTFNDQAKVGDSTSRLELRHLEASNGDKASFGATWAGTKLFARDDGPQSLAFRLENLTYAPIRGSVTVVIDGAPLHTPQAIALPPLAAIEQSVPFSPGQFPAGDYQAEVRLRLEDGTEQLVRLPLTIAPARQDERLPYLTWNRFEVSQLPLTASWGFNANKMWSSELSLPTREQLDAHRAMGFTHGGHLGSTTGLYKKLAAEEGLTITATRCPDGTEAERVNPFSTNYIHTVTQYVADQVAPYADHPTLTNLLVNTEKKEGPLAANPEALADARARGYLRADETFPLGFTDSDVPELDLKHPSVVQPKNGLIPADNLHYRTWLWWKRYGGYTPMHRALGAALDRVAPGVEMTVEFAPEGADWLEFWFRTAGNAENDPVFYNGHLADMEASSRQYGHKISALFQFVASEEPLSPDLFRESFWTVFSHRPDRMGHWGVDRALEAETPERQAAFAAQTTELARLQEQLAQPLYPALRQTERPHARVALLKSEASWLYQGTRASEYMHDWRSQGRLKYRERALSLANIAWEPIHDADVRAGALDHYDAVFVLATDVLTDDVFAELQRFARAGGKVFSDAAFAQTFPRVPGLRVVDADFSVIDAQSRWWPTEHDSAILQAYYTAAQKLRATYFATGLRPRAWLDNTTSATVNELVDGDHRIFFVINDRRDGPTAQAKGIAQRVNLRVDTQGERVEVYDLLEHRRLSHRTNRDGTITVNGLDLGPCDGRALLVTRQNPGSLDFDAPWSVQRGETFTLRIQSTRDNQGSLPIEVRLADLQGNPLQGSGAYALHDGQLELPLTAFRDLTVPVLLVQARYAHQTNWTQSLIWVK